LARHPALTLARLPPAAVAAVVLAQVVVAVAVAEVVLWREPPQREPPQRELPKRVPLLLAHRPQRQPAVVEAAAAELPELPEAAAVAHLPRQALRRFPVLQPQHRAAEAVVAPAVAAAPLPTRNRSNAPSSIRAPS
jgi:hypothetical protein